MAVTPLSFTKITPPETGECTICLFPLSGRKIVVQHAGDSGPMHPFHAKCIAQIAASLCPVCRAPVDLASIGPLESQKEKVTRYIWQSARHIAFAGGTTAVVLGLHRFFEQCEGGNVVQLPRRIATLMNKRFDLEMPLHRYLEIPLAAIGAALSIREASAGLISLFIFPTISPRVISQAIRIVMLHVNTMRQLQRAGLNDPAAHLVALLTHLLPLAIVAAVEHHTRRPLDELVEEFLKKTGVAEEVLGFDRKNWAQFLSQEIVTSVIDLGIQRYIFPRGTIRIEDIPEETLREAVLSRVAEFKNLPINALAEAFLNRIVQAGHVQEYNMPAIKLLYAVLVGVINRLSAKSSR